MLQNMQAQVAPSVSVEINVRWVHGTLQRMFGLNVASSFVRDVTREAVHVLENSLNAGHSVSLGEAVSEALDTLGYMSVDPTSTDVRAAS